MSAPVFQDGFERFTPVVESYQNIDPRDTMTQLIGSEGVTIAAARFAEEQLSRERAEVQRHMEDIYHANQALGEYCIEEQIEDIVFVDRSARPIWNTLREYLRLAHPDAPLPRMHFLNPYSLDTFITNPRILEEHRAEAIQVGKNNRKVARREAERTSNDLLNRAVSRVLLMDACVHSGRQMEDTRTFLKGLGINDLRLGAFTDSSDGNPLPFTLDFAYTDDSTRLHCKPYGKDAALSKTLSIYSGVEHTFEHDAARREAREIDRQLIQHFFASEQATTP